MVMNFEENETQLNPVFIGPKIWGHFPGDQEYSYSEAREKAMIMAEKGVLVDIYPEYSKLGKRRKT